MKPFLLTFVFSTFFFCSFLNAQENFQLNGNGSQADLGNDCFRLTTATTNRFGSMWSRKKADLTQDFDLTALLNFGNLNAGGADGITFAFQNLCTSAGGGGGGIGIAGVTPSFFVEFDTWQNNEFNDPVQDHIAILSNGNVNHNAATSLVAPTCALPNCGNIEDGNNHTVRILWIAATQTLTVTFDGELRASYTGDIVTNIFSGSPYVYWGFTAATGGSFNVHTVCIDQFNGNEIKLNDEEICENGSVQVNLPGGTQYAWTPETFISNTTISNPILNPPISTTYTVAISDACGNIQTDSIRVTVNPLPLVNFTPPTTTFCNGENAVTLTGASPSGGTFSGNGVTGTSFNPTAAGVGNSAITYSFTDANGCSNSATSSFSVVANPNVTLGSFSAICSDAAPITLSGGSPIGGTFSGAGVSGTTFNPSQASTGVNTITYSFTNAQGCEGTASSTIQVNASPNAQITSPNGTVICSGTPLNLNVSAQAGVSYQWRLNGNPVSTLDAANTSFTVTQAGTYTVRAVGNGSCERISSPVVITAGQVPSASITASNEQICPGASSTLTVQTAVGNTIQWRRNNVAITGANQSTFQATEAGTYAAFVSSVDGCTVLSNTSVISVVALPTASFTTSSPAFCPTITEINLQAPDGVNVGYEWLFNGNTIAGANQSSLSISNPGSYSLVTSLSACRDTSASLTISNGVVPVVSINSSSTSICEGSQTLLTASGSGLTSLIWFRNGTALSGTTASINASLAGLYTVQATSNDGCSASSAAVELEVIPGPVASISASNTTFCVGGTPVLLTANNLSGASYEWFRNNTSLGMPTSSNSFEVSQSGSYTVSVNNGTCSTISAAVVINSGNLPNTPGTIFGASFGFCPGEILDLSITNVSGATSYLWELIPATAGTIHDGQGTNAIEVNTLNQTFTVKVTPRNACGDGSSNQAQVAVDNSSFCTTFALTFGAFPTLTCTGTQITFFNYSDTQSLFGLSPRWNFGAGASPATANTAGPHNVTYSTTGNKTVRLEYVDSFGFVFEEETRTNYITISAGPASPVISGNSLLNNCTGVTETYQVNSNLGSTYNWTVPAGATLQGQGTAQVQVTFNGGAGQLTVVETNTAGCSSVAGTFTVDCAVGISEGLNSHEVMWNLFPNPAGDWLNYTISVNTHADIEFKLLDLTGKCIGTFARKSDGTAQPIYLGDYPAGVYIIQARIENKLMNRRIIKY